MTRRKGLPPWTHFGFRAELIFETACGVKRRPMTVFGRRKTPPPYPYLLGFRCREFQRGMEVWRVMQCRHVIPVRPAKGWTSCHGRSSQPKTDSLSGARSCRLSLIPWTEWMRRSCKRASAAEKIALAQVIQRVPPLRFRFPVGRLNSSAPRLRRYGGDRLLLLQQTLPVAFQR